MLLAAAHARLVDSPFLTLRQVTVLKLESPNAELFPELPVPVVQAKVRAPQKGKALAAKVGASAPVPTPISLSADLQASAKALEAHPDYRVLRRLQPRLLWPSAHGRDVVRVVVLEF